MEENKLKRIWVNISRINKSFTLMMFIGMIIITFVPALIAIPIEWLSEGDELGKIISLKLDSIIESWKQYHRLFVIPIMVDILITVGRVKPLNTLDFINNKIIYRDIIHKKSVIGLAYMDNFKEDLYKYVTITLLSLQLKERIQLKDNEIIVINDEDQYALRESEKVILNSIKSGKIVLNDSRFFQSLAKKEAIEDKLVKDNKDMKRNSLKLDKKMIKSFAIYILIISSIIFIVKILFPELNEDYISGIEIAIFLFSMVYISIAICVNAIINTISAEKSERTKLGEQINIKLEGLRNYIKNYSLLHEREKHELELWKEYLIYSVMFDQNKKIVEDVKKLIKFGF